MSNKYPIFLPGVMAPSRENISSSISQQTKTKPHSFNSDFFRRTNALTQPNTNRLKQSQNIESAQAQSNLQQNFPNNTFLHSQFDDNARVSHYDFKNDRREITLPAPGKHVSQKRISEYFPEVKDNDNRNSAAGRKRSLDDLKQKYDNVFKISANSSKSEIEQKLSYAEQVTQKRILQCSPFARGLSMSSKMNSLSARNSGSGYISIPKRKKCANKDTKNVIEPKMLHLIGYVEHIMRWDHILKGVDVYILYNVIGVFISAMDGTHVKEKFVFIRGNNGTILECSFFEIDRSLPKVNKGQYVSCFGRIIGIQRLRLFNIDILAEGEHTETQRAIFLSQRATHELCNRKSTF